jgi:hypothetical protein
MLVGIRRAGPGQFKAPGKLLDRKGLMGWVCLSVCLDVPMSRLYCSTYKIIMCKENKGNRPERKLEAQEKQAALHICFYIK